MFHVYRLLPVVLLTAWSGHALAQRSHDPPTSVPRIAQIAGIRVGYNTMEEMEQRLGEGMAYTGGHPRGAREWHSRGTRWYIDADAFDYNDRGTVIDDARISKSPGSLDSVQRFPPVPTTKRTHRKLGWLGILFPGLSKAQVLHAIHGHLPAPKRQGNKWIWTARGFVRLKLQQIYDTWTATLTFRGGRLMTISVECEGKTL